MSYKRTEFPRSLTPRKRVKVNWMRAVLAEHPDVTLDILPLHLSATSARALVETVFLQAQPPTGIYALNDEYALFLLGH